MKQVALLLLFFTLAFMAGCGQQRVNETGDAAAQTTPAVRPTGSTSTSATTALTGDVSRGAELFRASPGVDADGIAIPACSSCHATSERQILRGAVVAPSFVDLSTRAGTRVEGLSAEDYLRQSILEPSSYVLDGFSDAMYAHYEDILTEQDIADLIAYLLTL